jgi:hypothetical protein
VGDVRLEWDPAKAEGHRRQHGVTFEEAATALYDEAALVIPDPDHSRDEERFVLLGTSFERRVLVVCHCHRESSNSIRIISARRANARERRRYLEGEA